MSELPLRGHTTMTCPFAFCDATVDVAREQRHVGPSGGELRRIKIHGIEHKHFAWIVGDPCPASLMVVPLNDAAQAALGEFAIIYRDAIKRRYDDEEAQEKRLGRSGKQVPDIVRGGYRPDDGRHGREPRPNDAAWRQGPGSSRHHPPYNSREERL